MPGPDPRTPLFIGGCGRSGTTLLASALGRASDAVVTPESQFKQEIIRALRTGRLGGQPAAMYNWLYRDERFAAVWKLKVAENVGAAPSTGIEALRAVILDVVNQYAARQGAHGWQFWVDHTPENFREVATLLELFPQAKFIHIVRDGRAAAASVLSLDWGPNDIIRAARWWTTEVALGLAMEATHPRRVMRVRYEDLTSNPESWLREAAAFAGLAYVPEMLSADGFVLPGYTQDQHKLVGSPFDSGRNDAWRRTLSTRQVELFEAVAGDLMDILDYPRMTLGGARQPTALERLQSAVVATWRSGSNRVRYRRRVRASRAAT